MLNYEKTTFHNNPPWVKIGKKYRNLNRQILETFKISIFAYEKNLVN